MEILTTGVAGERMQEILRSGVENVSAGLVQAVIEDYAKLRWEMSIRHDLLGRDLQDPELDGVHSTSESVNAERRFIEDCLRGRFHEVNAQLRGDRV